MAGRPGGRRRAAPLPLAALVSLALVALTLLVAACGPRGSVGTATPAGLTVLAASSLREPLRDVSVAYEAAAGVRLIVVTDSSSALRVQIEQGAHADAFLSADLVNSTALATAGLTDGPIVEFAGNRLAIVVPVDNPGRLAGPADLARPGVAIVAAGDQVPITRYAGELVARLADLPGYPPGFAAAYTANVVTREDNVRTVLAKVVLGEGDAAIVYSTDAVSAGGVISLAIPSEAGVTATYAGVVLSTSADHATARAFLDWLAGPAGAAILNRHGFVPVP